MLEAVYSAERARIAALDGGAYEGCFSAPVFGEGRLDAPLMLIGEAPGANEAAEGRPFVGKAGAQLNALLAAAGLDRRDVFLTNAVKYRPTKNGGRANRTPSVRELREALPALCEELLASKASVVATLGNTPLRALTLLAGHAPLTVGEAHGRLWELKIKGKLFSVFPLYHPASCIYDRSLIAILEADMIELGKLMNESERRN